MGHGVPPLLAGLAMPTVDAIGANILGRNGGMIAFSTVTLLAENWCDLFLRRVGAAARRSEPACPSSNLAGSKFEQPAGKDRRSLETCNVYLNSIEW
jgi:hypothetical protein